jgi:hypothetical protein
VCRLEKDTIWLECTSSILPAGYLGDFTYNRPALIVDERGGTMVRTPTYKKSENLQIRKTNATVDDNGNITAGITTRYTGLQQDRLYGLYESAQPDQVLNFRETALIYLLMTLLIIIMILSPALYLRYMKTST